VGSSIYSNLSPTAHKLKLQLDDDQLTNCMRCGFCLPACPTYAETGIEAESPRGRIALMKAVADGIMEPDQVFEQQMNHCLGCRACEPACPADVKYGQLLEQARDAIEDHTQSHRWWIRMVRFLAFKVFFPQQRRMRILGMLLSFYQQSGLQYLTRKSGMMQLLPAHMRDMEKILPQASMRGVIQHIGEYHPAVGKKIATVALFRGCIMDVCFTQTNIHTVKLLQLAGFEVWIPREQSCCGALHAHSGEAEGARALARHNVRVFQEAGVDYVVSNAGGCGAILVEYDHLLHKETAWKEQAKSFAKKVIDISELLVRHGRSLPFQEAHQRGDAQIRITIQDSCHLRNVMKSSQAPRELIRQIPDVQLIEMKEADRCCGSAGIYNLTQPDMANQILDHKMTHTLATQAHTVITSNPGCLLQMKLGVKRNEDHGQESPHMKVEHIVDFMYDYLYRKPSSE
jgi:glycolate oxidase iron-sulfur subunit